MDYSQPSLFDKPRAGSSGLNLDPSFFTGGEASASYSDLVEEVDGAGRELIVVAAGAVGVGNRSVTAGVSYGHICVTWNRKVRPNFLFERRKEREEATHTEMQQQRGCAVHNSQRSSRAQNTLLSLRLSSLAQNSR